MVLVMFPLGCIPRIQLFGDPASSPVHLDMGEIQRAEKIRSRRGQPQFRPQWATA